MNARQGRMVTFAVVACALLIAAVIGVTLWQRHDRPAPPALAPEPHRADLVEVFKAARRLDLLRDGKVLRSYSVALGFDPVGHKGREGDGRTPEGAYLVDWRNPNSKFHLSLHISYPDERDKARAAAAGVSPGGEIMIHGQPNGMAGLWTGKDWTVGCIAVRDREIREIWSLVADGTRIVIHP